jgi:hypothetical protein
MKTITAAIRHARQNVSALTTLGNSYVYTRFDASANAWRQSVPSDYWTAMANRQTALIETAREFLGIDPYANGQYGSNVGGSWTKRILD